MLSRIFTFSLFLSGSITAVAQENTRSLTFSGYAETYYAYDAGNPQNHERPDFIYNHKRHNEVNINLAYLKAAYSKDNVRGNFAIMAGTYPQYNLANEQGLLKNIYEANAGFKLLKNRNLWLDAGVMPSHIGFESAAGKDCWNLTRSLLAENSPYYESGIKLGYTTSSEKLYVAAMMLNGWQRINRINNQQTPAFGTQLTLKPSGNFTFNWSTFGGNEFAGTDQRWRFFNNFYAIWQSTSQFGITAGFDTGMQEKPHNNGYDYWNAAILMVRYSPATHWRVAARAEYYLDDTQVIVTTGTRNGFQTLGGSLNLDYLPQDNVMLRFEGRIFDSKDEIFTLDNSPSNTNFTFTTALAISF